jgi:integrase/recombinase XerD
MGNLWQDKKTGVFRIKVQVTVDGKTKARHFTTGSKDKRAAKRFQKDFEQTKEPDIKAELVRSIRYPESKADEFPIKEAVQTFLKNIQSERGITDSTLDVYKLALNDFSHCFRNKTSIQELGKDDYFVLLKYFETKKKLSQKSVQNKTKPDFLDENLSKTTINIRLRGIRAFLYWAVEREIIDRMPFKVRQIKTDESLPKYISPTEFQAILANQSNENLRAIFTLYYETGIRLSEIYHSQLNGDHITIIQSKSRKQRIIPVNPVLYQQALAVRYSPSYIAHSFKKSCEAANVTGKTIHSLRHTFALKSLLNGVDIYTLAKLLGHHSVKVTEIYLEFPKDFIKTIFRQKTEQKTEIGMGIPLAN